MNLQKLTEIRELLYRMWQLTGSDIAFNAYNRARIRELDAKLAHQKRGSYHF